MLDRLRLAILFSGSVLFMAASASRSAEDAPNYKARSVRSLLEMRHEKVIVQQWDISCGAAALATILTYQHGQYVPEKTIAEAMLRRTGPLRVKYRGGFSLLDLKRFSESQGYTADGYTNLSLSDLVEFGPSIVPVNLEGYNHFVVFRGLVGNDVLIADPAFGNRTVTVERFQEGWLGPLAFVVRRADGTVPPDRLLAQPSDVVRPRNTVLRAAIRSGG